MEYCEIVAMTALSSYDMAKEVDERSACYFDAEGCNRGGGKQI